MGLQHRACGHDAEQRPPGVGGLPGFGHDGRHHAGLRRVDDQLPQRLALGQFLFHAESVALQFSQLGLVAQGQGAQFVTARLDFLGGIGLFAQQALQFDLLVQQFGLPLLGLLFGIEALRHQAHRAGFCFGGQCGALALAGDLRVQRIGLRLQPCEPGRQGALLLGLQCQGLGHLGLQGCATLAHARAHRGVHAAVRWSAGGLAITAQLEQGLALLHALAFCDPHALHHARLRHVHPHQPGGRHQMARQGAALGVAAPGEKAHYQQPHAAGQRCPHAVAERPHHGDAAEPVAVLPLQRFGSEQRRGRRVGGGVGARRAQGNSRSSSGELNTR